MKIKISPFFSLLTIILLESCHISPSTTESIMAFDDINYIHQFPESFSIQNSQEAKPDIIGIKSFAIHDSTLILSTVNEKGLWSFFSLISQRHLGDFLTKGQGPFEFIWPPSVSNYVKFSNNDGFSAYIYDSQIGRLLKMNIDRSFEANELDIYIVNDSIPQFLFNFVMLDNFTFLCKEVNNTQTQQIRYILNQDNTQTTPFIFKQLNSIKLREREDINIISTITKFNPENKKIVEMPIGLNYINIYTLDGTFSKTICIGEKMNDINKIQDQSAWNRIYTFADLRLFKDFFGVVYINEDEKTYQIKRSRLPEILLFDWNGEPLAKIKSDHFFTSFDIDFINEELYTLDVHSDEFYKYNAREILDKLKLMRR